MDDQQIRAVIETFEALDGRLDEFAVAFYARLFTAAPETRAMFPDDMSLQRQKLVDQLSLIVHALPRLGDVVELATELGFRHAGYGVVPAHYDVMAGVLTDALRHTLGERFDDEAAVAWQRAFHLVAELMMHGSVYGTATGA